MALSKIGVGIIGTGRISDLHAIEYLGNPASEIVALCDRNPDLAVARSKSWNCRGVAVTEDYRDLLARPDVDLVEILLPHHLHLPVALDAIRAGKIVSLQKPMCRTLDEADLLVAAAKSHDRPVKIFENFIFYPPVIRARQLVDAGAIGTPLSIRIKSNAGTGRNAWVVPESAVAWRKDAELSGGGPLVFDDGHHKFALAWHFMGMAEEVHAFIGETSCKDPAWEGGVLDSPAQVTFRFPGNRMGNLEVVYSADLEIETRHYAQDDRVEITGTHGIIWINAGHGRLPGLPPVTLYRDGQLTNYDDMETGWEWSFILSVRDFLTRLNDGGKPVLTASQGREVLQFALAAQESARTGRSVRIPATQP